MKSLLVLLLLSCATAQAEISSIEEYNQVLSGPDCLSKIEVALNKVTHPSPWLFLNPALGMGSQAAAYTVRKNVTANLNTYEKVAKRIEANLIGGVSNDAIYKRLEQSFALHSANALGRPIAACIRNQIKFNGSKLEQLTSVKVALSKIAQVRKAVN